MEENLIYYILGVLAIIYLAILSKNRRAKKKRKSRSFMEGKKRHGKDS